MNVNCHLLQWGREPTLDVLVDFNWRGGSLLQKYSLLRDPPK